jgi:hypothetical protein
MSAIIFWVGTPSVPPGTGEIDNPFVSIEFALTQLPADEYCVLKLLSGPYYDNNVVHFVNRQLTIMSDTNNPDDVYISEEFHFCNPGPNNQNSIVLKGITLDNTTVLLEDNNILSVDNCVFSNCTTALSFQWGINGEITNSVFCGNGYGISDFDGEYIGLREGLISNCLFYSNTYALSVNGVSIINCTFEGNQVVSDSFLTENIFTNCILWGNDNTLAGNVPSIFYYCDSQDQVDGDHNFSSDPRFVNSNAADYHLLWDEMGPSPCIDQGDPSTAADPDGTLPDIGCYYYPHHTWVYFDQPNPIEHPIYWLSFPVVDDRTYLDNRYWNELGFMFEAQMEGPPSNPSQLKDILWSYDGERGKMFFDENRWQLAEERVEQPKGYKVQFNSAMTIDPVVVSGFKADAGVTPVQWLAAQEDEYGQMQIFRNYIGYFVPYTQKMGRAFSKLVPGSSREVFLDHIYSIKKQEGGTCRRSYAYGSPWIIDPDMYTLSEGEMVDVALLPDAPEEMLWSSFSAPCQPITRQTPTAFEYQELLDYVPIFIEFNPSDIPDEVGIYVDDVCMGAAVVDSTLIEVNLYPLNAKNSGDIEIVFYRANKGKQKVNNWVVYNPVSLVFEDLSLRVIDLSDYAYISYNISAGESLVPLLTILEQNHPNPFNPNTSISFVLADDMTAVLEIYNLRGQKVRTLENTMLEKGRHTYIWNGRDNNGRGVSSGIYFSRLVTPESTCMQKMILMK